MKIYESQNGETKEIPEEELMNYYNNIELGKK